MNIVVFGLSVSSSWGNGHATLWRGLCRALAAQGHKVVFFEKDAPYYAAHRDLYDLPGGELILYESWEEVRPRAKRALCDADVGMVTSYCPDGPAASDLLLASNVPVRSFYDLDTPVTLHHLQAGRRVEYLPSYGLAPFDLVLSYTGGRALDRLKTHLGARRVVPLYGSVDPEIHHPVQPVKTFSGDFSYLGTYAEDRQDSLMRLFIEPARSRPDMRFVIGGAMYPDHFPWTANMFYVNHLPPGEHPAFYCSSPLTVNVTRKAMAAMGYCPQGRLFEAAACGAAIISDYWEGLESFYQSGTEIITATKTQDVLDALDLSEAEKARIARSARQRTLEEHTADKRAGELIAALEEVYQASYGRAEPAQAETSSNMVEV